MAHQKAQFIIGIDEAGRGPLAGPVAVGGVRLQMAKSKAQRARIATLLSGIKDSKKLSAKQREKWFAKLTAHPGIAWAVARVGPKTIDRINIARAANLGAWRVYQKLCVADRRIGGQKSGNVGKEKLFIPARYRGQSGTFFHGGTEALLDGGLRLPAHIPHKAIVKGDEKVPVIAAASIIAKVTRDRIMLRLHKKYPQYRFDIHKGYGTAMHRALLKKYGRSAVHRKSFHFKSAHFATQAVVSRS